MEKQEAIKAAEKLLLNIYGENLTASATIITASAENKVGVLLDALNATIEFIEDIKDKLK